MIAYRTRAQLKNEVKNLLRGNWKKAILLYLIPLIIFAATAGYNGGQTNINAQYNVDSFNSFVKFGSSFGIISFIISLVFLLIIISRLTLELWIGWMTLRWNLTQLRVTSLTLEVLIGGN